MSMFPALIRRRVRLMTGGDGSAPLQYLQPRADPGLFGPDSQAWRVHADFPSMMVGGIRALVLQALHPLALAGVWDHSSFREDLRGRLARTARFIAETTYGGTATAEQALERVRTIHARVAGRHPDGRPYRADDPQLLYWVHLTETTSFLHAYRVHVDPWIAQEACDAYFAEMSLIPRRLGCDPGQLRCGRIAQTEQQAHDDMLGYLEELEFSERTAFVLDLLQRMPGGDAPAALQRVFVRTALAELPGWAWPLLRRRPPSALQRQALYASMQLLARPLRWALKDGIAAHARRRMRPG